MPCSALESRHRKNFLHSRYSSISLLLHAESAITFQEAHGKNDLSFPVLSSVRIHFARRKAQEGGAVEPTSVRAVLVEAEDQDVYTMPNKSFFAMEPILKSLAPSLEELKIVKLEDIGVLPHVGMVVDGQKCDLALVLIGATEKSNFNKFGGGYRLTTKNLLDIGFDKQNWKPSEFRAGTKSDFEMVAICTEHNLTDYKMAPPRNGGVQYALLVISSARETQATGASEPRRKTFQVERIQTIETVDIEAYREMLAKLAYTRSEFTFAGTKRDRSAWANEPATPLSSGKKVRRLSASPTDASLPDLNGAEASRQVKTD